MPVETPPVPPIAAIQADVSNFRTNLLKAAKAARKSGTISFGDHLLVVATCLRPAKLAEWMEVSNAMAVEEGLATTQAIDWNALFAFLEKLLPLLISLFG